MLNEESAEMEIYETDAFGSLAAVPTRIIKLAAPDHYHYQEAGDHLYVGHLAKGLVQILDRKTGTEVGRIGKCPVLHGMAKDEASGRLFFACMANVMVIGTRGAEKDQEVARIPYPGKQRIAVFFNGRDRVLWKHGRRQSGDSPSGYGGSAVRIPDHSGRLVDSAGQQR
ncbi:MAG: hypothetical protein R3F24_07635 [Gammaproteobacteria bacterium]